MDTQLFREKSVERVSSPEQLNDYIHATSPGLWVFLASVILLLAGICVWGIFGQLDTTLTVAAVCENGAVTCYVAEDDAARIQSGMPLTVSDKELTVTAVGTVPVAVDDSFTDYVLHVGSLARGQWVVPVYAEGQDIPDGVYRGEVTIDSVSPLSFVLN